MDFKRIYENNKSENFLYIKKPNIIQELNNIYDKYKDIADILEIEETWCNPSNYGHQYKDTYTIYDETAFEKFKKDIEQQIESKKRIIGFKITPSLKPFTIEVEQFPYDDEDNSFGAFLSKELN